jgi:hypothetical protein
LLLWLLAAVAGKLRVRFSLVRDSMCSWSVSTTCNTQQIEVSKDGHPLTLAT